jgi:nicotinate-nucleotide adenylyltransferase
VPPVSARLRLGFTLARGMRVGLFGGSFNPPHDGHTHVAETAMARLGLDRVIWLVSPQNPLKRNGAAPLAERMAAARKFARGRRMIVSDAETRFGVRFTIDTLRCFKRRFPGVHFVWLMGADNLAQIHRWRGWPDIFRAAPIAVVSRPGGGAEARARLAPAARRFAHARLPEGAGRILATRKPPAMITLHAPLNPASSTAIRAGAVHADGSWLRERRRASMGPV